MSMGGGSQPAGDTTTTTSTQPWSGAQPYLTEANQSAANLYQNYTPQYFPGSTYQPLTGTQSQALQTTANLGANPSVQAAAAQPLAFDSSLMSGANITGNPGYAGLSSASAALNPYSSGAMMNAAGPYQQGLANSVAASVVPSIESQFIKGGGLSSGGADYATAQGLTAGLAPTLYSNAQAQEGLQQSAIAQQASDATNSGNLYNTGVGQEVQGLALAPSELSNLFTPAQEEYTAGTAGQTDLQNQINAAVQQWNYNQTLPYQQLQQLEGTITGQNFGTSATTQPYFENSTANALGTIGGGLSAANSAIGVLGK